MSQQDQARPRGISQVAIVVHDVDRASSFYRDALGLTHLFDAPGMAFFDCGGVRLMLSLPSEARFDHPASILYYDVADMDAAFERLKLAGARIEREPHAVHKGDGFELWLAFIHDTEGNVFALAAQRPTAS